MSIQRAGFKVCCVFTSLAFLASSCDSRNNSACLTTGDQSCIDWSQGQDAHIVEYPTGQLGQGLVTITRDNDFLYNGTSFAQELTYNINSKGTFVFTASDPEQLSEPQAQPQTIISQYGGFTVTQDVSYGKRVYGCIEGRATEYKRATRILYKKTVLLDIHSAVYRNEYGQRCWGIYNSGEGSSGPGVCFCEDENDPAPPDAVEAAVEQEMSAMNLPEIPYELKVLMFIAVTISVLVNCGTPNGIQPQCSLS